MNLLIVDDNAAVRCLIADIVRPLAGEIRQCADGETAVSEYSLHKPDFVLMDIRMKEEDGLEATKRIRAADPSARIVIVTNYDDDSLRQAAIAVGACAYALKDSLLDLVGILEVLEAKC